MGLKEYFIYAFPITILELIAAIAGTIYLKKVPAIEFRNKLLIYFLWFSFFIDFIGIYAVIGYFSKYNYFAFVEHTPFVKNYWLSNIYTIVATVFTGYYFWSLTQNAIWKGIIKYSAIIFLILALIDLLFITGFFKPTSAEIILFSTFLIFISVILFFFELLRSDSILNLKHHLPVYIAIGLLVFNLCMSPLSIFSDYFSVEKGNRLFVNLQAYIVLFSNIFMYSCFTLGLLICSRRKKFS